MPRLDNIAALESLRDELAQERGSYELTLTMCAGTACRACGCLPVAEAMAEEIERQGLSDKVQLRLTGCHGFCEQGPLAIIDPAGVFYCHLSAEDVPDIVARTLTAGEVIARASVHRPRVGQDGRTGEPDPLLRGSGALPAGRQPPSGADEHRRLHSRGRLRGSGQSAGHHGARSGDRGDHGLRPARPGRRRVSHRQEVGRRRRAADGEARYVICNADEGDPGAYMDRSVLEGNPHSVLEGMLIGAFADRRAARVTSTSATSTRWPSLTSGRPSSRRGSTACSGRTSWARGLSFDVEVARGGGAFVCGESTALMASLEGKVGEPRAKDVHTVERGYLDQPTDLNNVETWANVPLIISNGRGLVRRQGDGAEQGHQDLRPDRPGEEHRAGRGGDGHHRSARSSSTSAAGRTNGKQIKAVQTGGPSGGCLPGSQFDLPVDFEALAEAGSMMGSGGMVVMDESACMVDVAKYFLDFLQDESCGKCVPCRLGIDRMLEIVTDITAGRGTRSSWTLLEDLA